MKRILVTISFLSILFSCSHKENYKNCLDESLIKKLDVFKQELLDSIPSLKKDVSVNTIALKVLHDKQRILLNEIDFTDEDIKSIKICFHNSTNILNDSLNIDELVLIRRKPSNQNLITAFNHCNDDYLMLFWLYHLIDKNLILVNIEVINDDIIFLNGEKIKQFIDIRNKITELRKTLDSSMIKRAITSIKANKDSVSMLTIDQIENELRESDALRINYSTLTTKK